ncbi:MAG: 16S rRNA (uracil(1498)-N(3))-methyltransferase [Muribaculaceae bacterium]|nr:16S rRNA (uracil(1498)-N(3))-methyltransferase [Muribaculaceae bacterium]
MIQFYSPDIEKSQVLPESDSQHAIRMLRMGMGDELEIVDGKGHRFRTRILDPHPKRTLVEIIERIDSPLAWSYDITVAVAPTKNMDRMEWLVEKLTEIGVNRIVPVRCQRSERREIKKERLEKIAISAMKQSLKSVLPHVDEMTDIKNFINDVRHTPGQKFMGYCSDEVERRLMARACQPHTDTIILIGPEGDFTPQEVAEAIGAGFVAVTMGDNRLRTETAALVGCDTVHIINQSNG